MNSLEKAAAFNKWAARLESSISNPANTLPGLGLADPLTMALLKTAADPDLLRCTDGAYGAKPGFGLIYIAQIDVPWEEIVAMAEAIINGTAGPATKVERAWAAAVVRAHKAGRRLVILYTGLTRDSLQGRFELRRHSHLKSTKFLFGQLLKRFGVLPVIRLAFPSQRLQRARDEVEALARERGISLDDFPFDDAVLGHAESLTAAHYRTQLPFGGGNAGPTGGSPPHPNLEPHRLAKAVCMKWGKGVGAVQLSSAKELRVVDAMEECGGEACWPAVLRLLLIYAEPDERNRMTIKGLMTAVGEWCTAGCLCVKAREAGPQVRATVSAPGRYLIPSRAGAPGRLLPFTDTHLPAPAPARAPLYHPGKHAARALIRKYEAQARQLLAEANNKHPTDEEVALKARQLQCKWGGGVGVWGWVNVRSAPHPGPAAAAVLAVRRCLPRARRAGPLLTHAPLPVWQVRPCGRPSSPSTRRRRGSSSPRPTTSTPPTRRWR